MRRRELISMLGGTAVAWPLAVSADEKSAMRRIAIVAPNTADVTEKSHTTYWPPFFQALREHGYVEGRNLSISRYSMTGQTENYGSLAREMITANPDILIGFGGVGRELAKATNSVPIVANLVDPVGMGLVKNLARPGGNLTGVTVDTGPRVWDKWVETLREFLPHLARVGTLSPRTNEIGGGAAEYVDKSLRETWGPKGVDIISILADPPFDEAAYRRALSTAMTQRLDALVVGGAPQNFPQAATIISFAAEARLPAMYPARQFVDQGGLVAYAFDLIELFRQMGDQTAKILDGAKPGDIPIYQPTRFQLFLNLKTAKALGIEMPTSLLVRADEVVE
jgi:putative tryptophan/tyrosine transport system substrate-binding protein